MIVVAFLVVLSLLALHAWDSEQKFKRLRGECRFLEKETQAILERVENNEDDCTRVLESNDELRQEFKNLKFSLGLKTPKRKTKKSN